MNKRTGMNKNERKSEKCKKKLIFVKNKLSDSGKSNDSIIIVIPNIKHRINMLMSKTK